jgi:hypothetical protein
MAIMQLVIRQGGRAGAIIKAARKLLGGGGGGKPDPSPGRRAECGAAGGGPGDGKGGDEGLISRFSSLSFDQSSHL